MFPADSGQILVDGVPHAIRHPDDALRAGLVAVPQELLLAPDHSIAENVFLGRFPHRSGIVLRRTLRSRTQELLDRVGLERDPDTIAGGLSPVEQRLLMVAAALAKEARLLILDEPTASLPKAQSDVIARLVRQLSEDGTAIVYVSHRLSEVEALAQRVVAMRDGEMIGVLTGGEVTEERMLELLTGGLGFSEEVVAEAHAGGEVILEARGLSGRRVRGVNLEVRAGEVLGIGGLAGAGRSELLRLLFGVQKPTAGEVALRGTPLTGSPRDRVLRRMGYLTERRRSNAFHGMSVRSNVSIASLTQYSRFDAIVDRRAEARAVADVSEQVAIVGRPQAFIETLSGGNQQKALIARWLARGVDVLLLDEPTAGIDVRARAEIHHLLRSLADGGATIVVASAEPEELVLICDRVIVLVEGELRGEMRAPFDEERLIAASYGALAPANSDGPGE